MNVRNLIRKGSERIAPRWPDTPVLDASVILCSILGTERAKLLASYDREIDRDKEKTFFEAVEKRAAGYPVAYITGNKEFFGLDFSVSEGILIPRSDTEILVETVIKEAENLKNNPLLILDLCTGSGCIAIALKKSIPAAEVEASDISEISEKIFKKNCLSLKEKQINFIKSNLFENIKKKYDIIVSNPPYLTDRHVDEMVSLDWPEPESALRGGKDGLDFIRRITEEAGRFLKKGGLLAYEADPSQMDDIKQIMKVSGFEHIAEVNDLAGRKRVITGRYYGNGKN